MRNLFTSKKTLRKSGLIVAFVLVLLFFLLPYLIHQEFKLVPLIIASLITLFSLISPYSLRIPYAIWIEIGILLGKINSFIILFVFFYLIITPISILRTIFNIKVSKHRLKSNYEKLLRDKDFSNFTDLY